MEIQWPLTLFSLLAGSGGGIMLCVAIGELRGSMRKTNGVAALVAIAVIALGGCFSMLHLAHPQNVMAAVTNLGSFSGISLELIFLAMTAIAAVIYAVMVFRDMGSAQAQKAVAVIAGVLGLILSYVCGHGYVIEAQAAWDTETLAFAYAGTSLAVGVFAYLVVADTQGEEREGRTALGVVALVLPALSLIAVVAYLLVCGPERLATAIPAVLVTVLAAAASLVLAFLTRENTNRALLWAGLVCAVVAGLCLRILMWQVGTGFIDFFAIAAASPVLFNR